MNKEKTIIAVCCEKVSHHELLAAQAEQERKILQGELWRQQQDFREVHEQNLTEMKELQKFQNSTFDELTRQKFIEDQNTIMELSGRLQELQNEVNCMNDSKDFQDAESVRSGNSRVTSQPGVFPKHPPFEGLLRPSFVSPRRTDGPPNIWDTSGISGNVFANPPASSSAPYPQELNSSKYHYMDDDTLGKLLAEVHRDRTRGLCCWLEWYRGEDAGDQERSELNELVVGRWWKDGWVGSPPYFMYTHHVFTPISRHQSFPFCRLLSCVLLSSTYLPIG